MGLLDCVSDKRSNKYTTSPNSAPLSRGANSSSRRSLGSRSFGSRSLFPSNANKGRDVDFWRHRVLRFLYKSEGREDVRELRMPLRDLGYSAVGDFIRDIPPEIYEPYQAQLNPESGLRKDYKVIWERDGIAEPGMLKWEGPIDGQRCMGLQLDRKKAVPYNCFDGKGLFYCKPGHRALVPVHEVYPYKEFLRQFLDLPPRKDSIPLNLGLAAGRTSTRLTVAKKYTPGDRVLMPHENKWATILWTGRIDGEWVVDLVYDPDKPATGKMASPDEPCMSRSLSMAEFMDQLGSPPKRVPTPPPRSPEIQDEVFEELEEIPRVINKDDGLGQAVHTKKISLSEESEIESSMSEEVESDSDHSVEDPDPGPPQSSTESESETEGNLRRTFSEPGPEARKAPEPKRQEGLERFEPLPLQSRPTHKPLFNLSSFGSNRKKKVKSSVQPSKDFEPPPPKKEFSFFSKNKPKSDPKAEVNASKGESTETKREEGLKPKETTTKGPLDFFRRDRSKSPGHQNIMSISESDIREMPVDVPQSMRSPIRKEAPVSSPLPPKDVPRPQITSEESEESSDDSLDLGVDLSKEPRVLQTIQVQVEVEQTRKSRNSDSESYSSESSVPYSPAIKDVGFRMSKPVAKSEGKKGFTSPLKSFGSYFTPKKKALPPKDYEGLEDAMKPDPPLRKESLEGDESSGDSGSISSLEGQPPTPVILKEHNTLDEGVKEPEGKSSFRANRGGIFSSKKSKVKKISQVEPPGTTKALEISSPLSQAPETLGDQDGLTLDLLDVKDYEGQRTSSPSLEAVTPTKQKASKASGFSFGFSKKAKPLLPEAPSPGPSSIPEVNLKNLEKTPRARSSNSSVSSSQEYAKETVRLRKETPTPTDQVPKAKRSSLKDSFSRTFSFGKGKRKGSIEKYEKLEDSEATPPIRPLSLYIDNNEAIGATRITRPKSTSVLVDIQPWNERKGYKTDIMGLTYEPTSNDPEGSKNLVINPIPALLPKNPAPLIPEHRKFTTPKIFKWPQKSAVSQPLNPNPSTKASKILKKLSAELNEQVQSPPPQVKHMEKEEEEEERPEVTLEILLEPVESPPPPPTPEPKPKPQELPPNPPRITPRSPKFTTKVIINEETKSTKSSSLSLTLQSLMKSPLNKNPTSPPPLPSFPTSAEEPIEVAGSPVSESPPPLPKAGPPQLPTSPPPPLTPRNRKSFTRLSSTDDGTPASPLKSPALKSALKQRKEIEFIPKGLKVGDRVIWYSGRIPVPGTVMKLFKDGTDKYTAVVKFDREPGKEPLSLTRDGDAYIVTVEELITPQIFAFPSISSSTPTSPPPTDRPTHKEDDTKENSRPQSVRFQPPQEGTPVPVIYVDPGTPASPKEGISLQEETTFQEEISLQDETIPPPFQEEEIEIACGLRRGIPSRERSCCLETLLFAMFYTTNTFDTSILYESGFEEDRLTREAKSVLRQEIVHPLRRSGFCEWTAVKRLKDLMTNLDPDFNSLITDAEIMTSILFGRSLKLGKFISYSKGVTDYLHQLVFDPRDLSKSSTVQQLLETSLEHMDNAKFRTVPTPAFILEIPRANDKLIHYEAVVPNLTLVISHLLENGPRLCLCGMVAKFECPVCLQKYGGKALAYCDSCRSTGEQQVHFKLDHEMNLIEIPQQLVTMDLVSVICIQGGHYTAFVKCGTERMSPWLFYDAAEVDNPKVSLEHNLGMWIDRLEKYPGKYADAFAHPLLTHFLANSHICIYQSREKSSLV